MSHRLAAWCVPLLVLGTSACATIQRLRSGRGEAVEASDANAALSAATAEAPAVAPSPPASSPAAAAAPSYPPEDRFEAYPYVREGEPGPDGAYDASVHPWFFHGSLQRGEGDCAVNASTTFASVKDLGFDLRRSRERGLSPECSLEVQRMETSTGPVVHWAATCVFDQQGVHVVSVRQLAVDEAPTHRGSGGEWLHRAGYTASLTFDGELGYDCRYVGEVGRRAAAQR